MNSRSNQSSQSSINNLFGFGAGALSQTTTLRNSKPDDGRPSTHELPALVQVLSIFFRQNATEDFFTGAIAMNDVQFTGQRPIVGVGHHFVVYASPFGKSDDVPTRVSRIGGEVYCIKSPNTERSCGDKSFRDEYYQTVLQELQVLSHPDLMNHENIIGLLGLDFQEDYDDNTLCWPSLLLEYSMYGTLDSFQADMNGLSPDLARNLLCDIATGLQALHRCNIIHGDVKSENVLVCGHPGRQYVAKLSDFGLAVVNPSPTESHYLPGCTWLWSAPEILQPLTVDGLKFTDIYSFGLTAWRVLLSRDDPFSSVLTMPCNTPDYRLAIQQIKTSSQFPQLVFETMADHCEGYVVELISATLALNPNDRNLERVLQALSGNYDHSLKSKSSATSYNQQFDSASAIIGTIAEAFPADFIPILSRPSVVCSLLESFDSILDTNLAVKSQVAELYFALITSPAVQLGDKGIAKQCKLLKILQQHGYNALRIMAYIYGKLYEQPGLMSLDPGILETESLKGSYTSLQISRTDFKEQYESWGNRMENNILNSNASDTLDKRFLLYCQTGNLTKCHDMLNLGATGLFGNGDISPLHYLATHADTENESLIHRLIDAGAPLDQCEGTIANDCFSMGRAYGMPLHWAVIHRNVPAIRALTTRDQRPQEDVVKRAFFIAAAMHFYDVLEILRDWALPLGLEVTSEWMSALHVTAAAHLEYHQARTIRHGDYADNALYRTLDVLSTMVICPTLKTTLTGTLLTASVAQNNISLLRYFLNKLDRPTLNAIGQDKLDGFLIISVMYGYFDIFKLLYARKTFTLRHRFGMDKFTGIQVCFAVRQRNPQFVRSYIEWGCDVDEMGDTVISEWTPFAMAVQCGFFDTASMLLRHGANKDLVTGWLGGTTPLFRMLHTWPDVPISRVQYLLEELPRQGFGHVSFIGWPANDASLLYCFSMAAWSHYRNSYKFAETMRYIINLLGDKSSINKMDGIGCTALNQAARSGNLEVVRVLIEAGADVNSGLGISPLNAAMDWRDKWARKEQEAMNQCVVGERRHAAKIRARAEELIDLLRRNGAQERDFIENQRMMLSTLISGDYRLPSMELVFELASGIFDRSSMVRPGSVRAHPTQKQDFTAHRGAETSLQSSFRRIGRFIDGVLGTGGQINSAPKLPPNTTVQLYAPHSCYPWQPCPFANGRSMQQPPQSIPTLVPRQQSAFPVASSIPGKLSGPNNLPQPNSTSRASLTSPYQAGPISNHASSSVPPQPANYQTQRNTSTRSSRAVQSRLRAALDPKDSFYDTLPSSFSSSEPSEADLTTLSGATLTRDEILHILQTELSEPIQLPAEVHRLEECEDIAMFESTVREALGEPLIAELGLEFVHELSENGRSWYVYLRYTQEDKAGDAGPSCPGSDG